MNPLDETWTARNGIVSRADGSRVLRVYTFGPDKAAPAKEHVAYDDKVAALLAAAPDLVRVLLEHGRSGGDGGCECIGCGWTDPHPCDPDCVVDAALRKAGAR